MPTTEILNVTTDKPSEKNPGAVTDEYKVPADQPRAIAINSLGIEAYVQRVGIDINKNMVAPNNIYFAGWYVGSVAPGEKGVSIINGHDGGRYADGVFKHLVNVKSDDIITVQMGDNSWREFVVRSVDTYPVEASARALFADDSHIDRELHLITCDGVFDDRTQTYDRRLIVTAELKSGM